VKLNLQFISNILENGLENSYKTVKKNPLSENLIFINSQRFSLKLFFFKSRGFRTFILFSPVPASHSIFAIPFVGFSRLHCGILGLRAERCFRLNQVDNGNEGAEERRAWHKDEG